MNDNKGRTNSDTPSWDCNSCKYAGPVVFEQTGQDCVECRRNHPGTGAFPIMQAHSWCWDGRLSDRCTNELMKASARELAKEVDK